MIGDYGFLVPWTHLQKQTKANHINVMDQEKTKWIQGYVRSEPVQQ